ncbi:ATP-dependent RNA helicase [Pseudoscourfieldia marina]
MRAPIVVSSSSGSVPSPPVPSHLSSRLSSSLGVTSLFPIQVALWNLLAGGEDIARNDVAISAPTGSGKTIAFALPLVARCLRRRIRRTRLLVVTPTRELASQIHRVIQALGANVVLVAGSADVATEARELAQFPDAAVATPGRLVEHIRSKHMHMDALEAVVVDEVDRLLKQHYHGWAGVLNAAIDATGKQVLRVAASATVTKNPARLLTLGLRSPVLLAAREGGGGDDETAQQLDGEQHDNAAEPDYRHQLPARLVQARVVVPNAEQKSDALVNLLRQLRGGALKDKLPPAMPDSGVLVFCASNAGATALATKLRADASLDVTEYSTRGNRKSRAEALAHVAGAGDGDGGGNGERRTRVLVCTDALTRGIDIPVNLVVSYDAPLNARAHVHRVGRTARGGNAGAAVTLLYRKQVRHFKAKIAAKLGGVISKIRL